VYRGHVLLSDPTLKLPPLFASLRICARRPSQQWLIVEDQYRELMPLISRLS
jgi:hypothetical protein